MRFFNKVRNGNKIIFSILGFKIKYKVKSDQFMHKLMEEWQTNFQPQELELKLKKLIHQDEAQRPENKEFFLILASTLIENDKENEAIEVLKNYINKFGLEHISSFPLVACLTDKLGLADDKVKQCAHAFKTLEENRTNNSLEKLLQNKKLAIVGNSPNLIEKRKGNQIDAADIVVRFNNYRTQDFEADYGSKTNIWVCCQANDIVNRPLDELKKMDYILYNVDLKHTKLQPKCLEYICKNLETLNSISYIGDTYKKNLKQFGVVYPSSGMTALCHFHGLCPLSKENIFGFSFLENASNYYDHYFQKRSARTIKKFRKNGHHNFDLENAVLRKIFEV